MLCLLITSPALAQDESAPVSPTEEQTELNEDGVRALAEGDYVQAISILEEALYLGELNIAYLNLGRAYQQAGRCEDARRTLHKVDEAPPVESPSPGFVNSKAEQYLEQLEESCGEAASESEGEGPDPGASEAQAPGRETTGTAAPPSPGSPWGMITTVSGGVLMAGAVGMHFLWAEPIRDDARDAADGDLSRDISQRDFVDAEARANSVDTAALVTGVTGGLVTGLGLYLWLADEGPTRHSVSVSPSRAGTSVTYRLRF